MHALAAGIMRLLSALYIQLEYDSNAADKLLTISEECIETMYHGSPDDN